VERREMLAMLVLSIRTNVREITQVLEELNSGAREKTYPHTLTRCFRTIEHDARVVGLDRLGDMLGWAKEAAARVLDAKAGPELVELFSETTAELLRIADDVEQKRRHELDRAVEERLKRAAGPRLEE
jgi:hypothetical protein